MTKYLTSSLRVISSPSAAHTSQKRLHTDHLTRHDLFGERKNRARWSLASALNIRPNGIARFRQPCNRIAVLLFATSNVKSGNSSDRRRSSTSPGELQVGSGARLPHHRRIVAAEYAKDSSKSAFIATERRSYAMSKSARRYGWRKVVARRKSAHQGHKGCAEVRFAESLGNSVHRFDRFSLTAASSTIASFSRGHEQANRVLVAANRCNHFPQLVGNQQHVVLVVDVLPFKKGSSSSRVRPGPRAVAISTARFIDAVCEAPHLRVSAHQ